MTVKHHSSPISRTIGAGKGYRELRCDCGAHLTAHGGRDVGCGCGRNYNAYGQLLAPRSLWSEG